MQGSNSIKFNATSDCRRWTPDFACAKKEVHPENYATEKDEAVLVLECCPHTPVAVVLLELRKAAVVQERVDTAA
jgi:hypothetical protein